MDRRKLLMAYDKVIDSTQLDADLTTVAAAIRTKGGTSAQLSFPSGFASAIAAISTGGTAELFGIVSYGDALYAISDVTATEDGTALILT